MKVYIVYRDFGQTDSLVGVYASIEAAEKAIKNLEKFKNGSSYFWDEEIVQE